MEASTNQVADQHMPVYDLPPKILCRVINVQLKVVLVRSVSLFFVINKKISHAFEQSNPQKEHASFFQAEPDTDEVFAQVTLLPEPNVSFLSSLVCVF